MDPVFSSLSMDMLAAVGLGAIGGLALGLLQEKGLEMPRWYTESGVNFADLGFIADILIGALAAIITYALNPPTEMLKLVAAAVTAGIGGSGILKGYIKGTAARQQASRAEKWRGAAMEASKGIDLATRLSELEAADNLMKRRWGAR